MSCTENFSTYWYQLSTTTGNGFGGNSWIRWMSGPLFDNFSLTCQVFSQNTKAKLRNMNDRHSSCNSTCLFQIWCRLFDNMQFQRRQLDKGFQYWRDLCHPRIWSDLLRYISMHCCYVSIMKIVIKLFHNYYINFNIQ